MFNREKDKFEIARKVLHRMKRQDALGFDNGNPRAFHNKALEFGLTKEQNFNTYLKEEHFKLLSLWLMKIYRLL